MPGQIVPDRPRQPSAQTQDGAVVTVRPHEDHRRHSHEIHNFRSTTNHRSTAKVKLLCCLLHIVTVPPPVRIFVPLRSPSYIYG